MSDQYAVDAIVRWGDDGQVTVLWEMESSVYGFTVAPEMFDQMHLGDAELATATEADAPVVMQLMVFDASLHPWQTSDT